MDATPIWAGTGSPTPNELSRSLLAEWLSTGRLPAPRGTAVLPSRNGDGPAAELTVNELILAYWRYAQGYYRKNDRPTDHLYLVKGVLLLREYHGRSPVTSFGPKVLKALRAAVVSWLAVV